MEAPRSSTRDWMELPLDALETIFAKLSAVDILMGAGLVCHSWLDAAEVPSLWRCVDMASHELVEHKRFRYGGNDVLCAMAKLAVDRSNGQLQEFSGRRFVTAELLNYIGDRSPSLKTLRLKSCPVGTEAFSDAIKKFPLLEELDITLAYPLRYRTVYEIVGKHCPHLKSFKQIIGLSASSDYQYWYWRLDGNSVQGNDEALGIATMAGLRSLQLIRSDISNTGLEAILNGCPHLDSLDIRQCFYVKMGATMEARLASLNLNSLKLPDDSIGGPYQDDAWMR
ncbi:unnamed protein product [Urochloa decumbens]|uniref:F-box domain-containing protein n=1 Tax=Urochloa decumbens TaxID=240449 RepID=A0ABC9BVP6_9POAL